VDVTLQAKNLAGREAVSAARSVTLPLLPLHDPTAQLLSITRQNLALRPEQAPSIAQQLMHTAQAPPSRISYAVDVQLAALATTLRLRDTSPAQAVTRLLALIRQIEAGPDYAASQAFAHAAQALLQALRQGNADKATLNRLLQAMQQALAQHLAALSQASGAHQGQTRQNFDPSALSRLAQQIAADRQAGRNQQAQAALQQLAAALQALQTARPMSAAEMARAQAAAQSAQALSQLMQNQAKLLDQTAKGDATPGQQGQLRAGLQSLGAGLQKAGIGQLPGLGQAGQSMQTAQSALSRQDNGGAQSAESAAIQHLQQAAAALQRGMQQSLSLDANGGMPGAHGFGDSQNGSNDDNASPDLGFQRRNPADAIEQEIIKRDADPALPAATHHYLRRLLAPEP
jgi:NADH dehydrogenase/NADH:ubiquinone oxidoreductase subunit G